MNKFHPGDYHIQFFDLFGTKYRMLTSTGFIAAQELAEATKDHDRSINSYVIYRVLFNSLKAPEPEYEDPNPCESAPHQGEPESGEPDPASADGEDLQEQ